MNAGIGGLLVGVVPGVATKNMRVGVATGVVAGAAMAASTFWCVQPISPLHLKAQELMRCRCLAGPRARSPLSRSTPRLASLTERKRRSEEEPLRSFRWSANTSRQTERNEATVLRSLVVSLCLTSGPATTRRGTDWRSWSRRTRGSSCIHHSCSRKRPDWRSPLGKGSLRRLRHSLLQL